MSADHPPSAEPLEVEVKLGVSRPGRIAALIAEPDPAVLAGFEAAEPLITRTVVDQYLDTAEVDGRLSVALMRARLRHRDGRVTLTVKRSSREQDGVTERVELEGPATRYIAPHDWPASAARTALLEVIGSSGLVEIARLRQARTVRVVRRGGTRVELSLDRLGALVDGRVVARRNELEAELLEGDRADLADLAAALTRIAGLGPPLGSKLAFAIAARTRQDGTGR